MKDTPNRNTKTTNSPFKRFCKGYFRLVNQTMYFK